VARVLVVGITGAGKTTLARALAAREGLRSFELDALMFGPGWSESPRFLADAEEATRGDRWVTDSYGARDEVRALIWARADTIVWLDYPLAVVMARVLRRSLRRTLRRTPVFGGNVETWRGWLRGDHPVWWALRKHRERRRVVGELIAAHAPARVVRLRTPREAAAWLSDAGAP
jgi:adenylate kinase family enzyme